MRILTVAESQAWLGDRGVTLQPAAALGHDHVLDIPASFHRVCFGTPADAKRQASLSHLLAQWFQCEGAFLLVNVVALFEPYELDAFLFLRRAYGDFRWIDGVPGGATPGHHFCEGLPQDRRNVREFLSMMMAYTFEGYFVQADGKALIWVADDLVEVASIDESALGVPCDVVSMLDLKVYGAHE
jgi:hypothetical protein